jgi:HAD superfamily hydrolase (TIGR01509 family)
VRRLTVEKEVIFRDLVRQDSIEPVPGAVEFVRELHRRNIPLGVGSSAPRENIEACLEALRLNGAFASVVSGGEVVRGKPAPDIFLNAARRLGMDPERCIVFEDAPAGVAAAQAAGMRVVGLLTAHSKSALDGATRHARDFTELSVEDIVAWATQRAPVGIR